MITNRELNLPTALVVFDKDALKFRRQPTWEEWMQVTEYVLHCRKASLRWMADALREGRKVFGMEQVEEFEKQLEIQLPEIKAAAALEKLDLRLPDVSDEVHLKVASKVSDPELRTKWLDAAAANNLNAREVQWSIAATPPGAPFNIVKEGAASRKAGVLTIEGIMAEFAIWRSKIDFAEMDTETLDRLLEVLTPANEAFLKARQLRNERLDVAESEAA